MRVLEGRGVFEGRSKKKQTFLIMLLGIIGGLSTIPIVGFQTFFFIAFSGLLLCSNTSAFQARGAFLTGAFAFGYFLMALHWVPFSLHTDFARYFWMVPFALMGLPLLFGLYHWVGAWAFPWYKASGLPRGISLSLLWFLLEIFRAEFMTGFPWASLGYMWTPVLEIAQLASVVGPYGLSFLTCLWFMTPYIVFSGRGKLYAVCAILTFAAAFWWGHVRMMQAEFKPREKQVMRMIQPNSPQHVRWTRARMEETLASFESLSVNDLLPPPSVVIWPEFAMPFTLVRYPWMAPYVRRSTPEGGVLLTNAFRYESLDRWPRGHRTFNSIMAFDHEARPVGYYDKYHLLPFGEFIPLRKQVDAVLPGQIHKMSGGIDDFCSGVGARVVEVQGMPPFLPMLCFESNFSGKHGCDLSGRPQWILNITNDGWFLHSLGPYQHLEITRMRAIEEGVPLVRVANTGISAVIDALGQTRVAIPYGKAASVDFRLPPVLKDPPFYARLMKRDFYTLIYHLILLGLFVRLLFLFIANLRRRRP